MPVVKRTSTLKELTRRTRKRQQTFLPPEPEVSADALPDIAAAPVESQRVPEPPPCRMALARWPDEWRERWGRRANELEDEGLNWYEAESRAFLEIWNERRALGHTEGEPAPASTPKLDASRN